MYNTIENLKEKIKNNQAIVSYLSTGIEPLDKELLGYQNGELITIASRVNGGKTSLALKSALNAIENQQNVLYILMGESKELFISKLLAIRYNIPIKLILTSTYNPEIKPQLLKTLEKIEKYLTIKNDIYIDIDDISQLIEYEMASEIELVIIDSLQFITSIVDTTINTVKELKRLAYISQIPIVLLNNLDITKEKQYGEKPIESDFLESKDIFNYSDKVIVIYNDAIFHQRREELKELQSQKSFTDSIYKSAFINIPLIKKELIILKNKYGEKSFLHLNFRKETVSFQEIVYDDIVFPDDIN